MSLSPFNWIRDILGIRKDLIDTEKARAELRQIHENELAKYVEQNVDFEDIVKYDPKLAEVIRRADLSGRVIGFPIGTELEAYKERLIDFLIWWSQKT